MKSATRVQRPLRVGVFGTGRWAREVHAPGIRATAGFELAGIHGRNAEHAASLANAMQTASFASFDDMLGSVDAISFAVPPGIQSRYATIAARARRHVILEKPIAADLAAADELVDAIEAAGISSVVFLTRLFLPGVRDLLATARAEGVMSGEAFFHSSALLPGSRYPQSSWRHERFGALWDVAPHTLAVLMQAMGPVAALRASNPSPAAFEAELRHLSGGLSHIHINLMDRTAVRVDDCFSFEGAHRRLTAGPFTYDRPTTYARAARTLLDGDGYANVALGRDVVAVIEAIIASVGDNGATRAVAAPRWRLT